MRGTILQTDSTSPTPSPESYDALVTALERKQAELELIGSVASHDLRAPVRIVLSVCEQLNANAALAADADGREMLQAITEETERLRALIEGLLEYVRLETFTPSYMPLDGNELIAAAQEVLTDEIRRTDATVVCEPLPTVFGHRGRLTRLFIALIDNAIKFRTDKAPVIRVSVKRAGDQWEFCVEDNGIGIEEELQPLIYKLFQRLHPDDEYSGYGIGLALSRKIVVTHGGRLWVESAPGQGSRFYFTLPVNEEASERSTL